MKLFRMYLLRALKKFEGGHNADQNNPYSCDACDFVGKNKAGLIKHMKSKHENGKSASKPNRNETTTDDFTDKINDFLTSVNCLNNSENNFPCDKCSLKFASKDFLNSHWRNPQD